MARRPALAIGAAAMVLAAAAPAGAAPQVTHDSAGRPIHFDVQAQGADVAGYTAILDGLLHGNEISDVTVTIVPQSSIAGECGTGAAACYRWSSRGDAVMFVPSQAAAQVRGALTHEYGHHVDATRPHIAGAGGLDGTPGWWRARGVAALLAQGQVAWDYSRGWDRSIAEVFAEDYKLTNTPGETSRIGWLGPPPPAVSDAIRADLAGPTVAPAPPAQPPLPPPAAGTPARTSPGAGAATAARASGRLGAGRRAWVRFAIRFPRRVAITVSGVTAGRVRAVLRCNGKALGGAAARRGRPATVTATRVPRGACRVGLRAIGASSRYRVLAVTTPVVSSP
ncbi:MAG TPA: hypothetical protein VHK00_06875 [Miltoncostaeaceae bacterium]|nr:hypothetical protein [Miltoncostaeaceae bacterium]